MIKDARKQHLPLGKAVALADNQQLIWQWLPQELNQSEN